MRLTLVFALLLAALSGVIWRQSRALETLRSLDRVRQQRALLEAERREVVRRIQLLESRSHVVAAARSRLGMHVPNGTEIVILPLEDGDELDREPEPRGGSRNLPVLVRRWFGSPESADAAPAAVPTSTGATSDVEGSAGRGTGDVAMTAGGAG